MPNMKIQIKFLFEKSVRGRLLVREDMGLRVESFLDWKFPNTKVRHFSQFQTFLMTVYQKEKAALESEMTKILSMEIIIQNTIKNNNLEEQKFQWIYRNGNQSFPTFLSLPSSTNFLLGAWIVEFTTDLGELSVLSAHGFGPFICMFLHIGGGAKPDNCKRKMSMGKKAMWKADKEWLCRTLSEQIKTWII